MNGLLFELDWRPLRNRRLLEALCLYVWLLLTGGAEGPARKKAKRCPGSGTDSGGGHLVRSAPTPLLTASERSFLSQPDVRRSEGMPAFLLLTLSIRVGLERKFQVSFILEDAES